MVSKQFKKEVIEQGISQDYIDRQKSKINRNLNIGFIVYGILYILTVATITNKKLVFDFHIISFVFIIIIEIVILMLKRINKKRNIDETIVDAIQLEMLRHSINDENKKILNKNTRGMNKINKALMKLYMYIITK